VADSRLLHRHDGHKPKREFTNACTPCKQLIPQIGCRNMCCRQLVVTLAQEDLDDGLETQPPFVDVLKKSAAGVCNYLDRATGDCTVWERRPLACRVYDCQQDPRLPWRLLLSDAPKVLPTPERCHGCGRPPRILVGASAECDGHVVCIDCGAPWKLATSLTTVTLLGVVPVDASPETRARYRFNALMYRQQWPEALADVDRRLDEQPTDAGLRRLRAVLWTHLERFPEAERELRRLATPGTSPDDRNGDPQRVPKPPRDGTRRAKPGGSPRDEPIPSGVTTEAILDLAWLLTRTSRDQEAISLLETQLGDLDGLALMRAHLILGKIHRRADHPDEAARHYVAASLAVKPGPLIEEHFQELRNDGPAGAVALQRQLMLRSARG
jgi:hypothetical protein